MVICLNGAKREIPEGMTLEKLMELFQLTKKSIVMELNHHVVSKSTYSSALLRENDAVEIVHFVGGG